VPAAAAAATAAVPAPALTASARRKLLSELKVFPTATPEKPRPAVEVAPAAPTQTNKREVEVPLRLDERTAEGLRVYTFDRDGSKEVPGAIKHGGGGAPRVAVARNRSVVVAPDRTQAQVVPLSRLSKDKSSFPGVILKATDAPGGGTRLQKLELTMHAAYTPMRWRADRHQYAAEILVGVDPGDGPAAALDRQIVVQFGGDNVIAEPRDVAITHAGTEGYRRIALYSDAHAPRPRVTAYSDLGALAHEIDVGPKLARLALTPRTTRILAFGLESTTLALTGLAEDGLEIKSAASIPVILSATRGQLSASKVVLAGDGSHPEVNLSSSSGMLGAVDVVAQAQAVVSAPVRIVFVFPWILLATVIFAGGLGGYIGYLHRMKRAGGASRKVVVEGAIVGPVLVLAVIAGVPLIHMESLVQNDVGRFTIAVVFGMMGTPAMALLKNAVAKVAPKGTGTGQGGGGAAPAA
jgi:hypothetical protein